MANQQYSRFRFESLLIGCKLHLKHFTCETIGYITWKCYMQPAEGAVYLLNYCFSTQHVGQIYKLLNQSYSCKTIKFLLERVLMSNFFFSPREVLGVVEVMIRRRSGPESGSVMLKEKRVGALTKKTLVAQRMRRMMMAGPLSAAEQQPLHPFGLLMIN